MKKLSILICILLLGVYSCKKETTDYPNEPQIYYLSTNPNQIQVTNPNEYITIQFRFTDGDQDLADDPNESDSTIFIKDSRDTGMLDYTYTYPMPYIAKNLRPDGGLEGVVTLHLSNAYFSPRDSQHLALGKDTMVWFIHIMDNAGQKSNTIQSDTIYLNYQ